MSIKKDKLGNISNILIYFKNKFNKVIDLISIIKFNSKLLTKLYFIFFIALNIADFYGISGDLDFFKKLLSWYLIGYLFYLVSPTKIFIGTRVKIYDFLFIISYSLMSIVKSLLFYVTNYREGKFHIFDFFLRNLYNLKIQTTIISISFFIGIIFIVILSIKLLSSYKKKEDSLIGSFKLNDYLEFIKFDYIILIFFNIFFAITIFNLFMEWFALAVDSIILVLGLVYYSIKFIKSHSKFDLKYLDKVSNSGGNFFQNLINTFSNKKTILIGISFILALHLLVDAGAYLIPYTIGTGSSLYFNNLNIGGTDHTPIFNFKNLNYSQIHNDLLIMQNSGGTNLMNLMFIIMIYILILFLFYALLIMPFYFLYKNIRSEKILLNKYYIIFFLSSLILFIFINVQYDHSKLINTSNDYRYINYVTIPIGIENINPDTFVSGVDIYTNNLISNCNVIVSILVFLISMLFLTYFFKKFKKIFLKSVIFISFLFFIFYISLFSISRINLDIHNINIIDKDYQNKIIDSDFENYNNSKDLLKFTLRNKFKIGDETLRISFISKDIKGVQNDYIKINVKNVNNDYPLKNQIFINKDFKLITNSRNNLIFYKDSRFKYYFGDENNLETIIIKIGQNVIDLNMTIKNISKKIKAGYLKSNGLYFKFNDEMIFIYDSKINYGFKQSLISKKIELNSSNSIRKISSLIQLIFTIIFYLFGIIFYSYIYIKSNILNNEGFILEDDNEEIRIKDLEFKDGTKFKYFKSK